MGAVVAQVAAVLGRGHALFGDPPTSGASAAAGAGRKLFGAGDLARSGQHRISALSGQFPTGYGVFAGGAGPALDGLAGADDRLSGQLAAAGDTDRGGRGSSGAVVNGAAADTAGLAPFSNTPAGQKALLTALRARVAQQQQVVAAHRARDAQMAALLRSMTYAGRGGLGGGGGAPLGRRRWWFGDARRRATGLVGGVRARAVPAPRGRLALAAARDIPAGPAGVAVRAALTRLGRPYVWGAEGPSSFDCSGYTEWAWRQAGVQLGEDTYAQVKQGVPVPPGQVRAGDLIFPKDSFNGQGPGHVMLAISPTQVAHAPQAGDVVRVAAMPSAYVARRPVPLG